MKKNTCLKGQVSFFMKVLFIVASGAAILIALMYINSFRSSTTEERGSAEFKTEVLNTLQKIISDDDCLAFKLAETLQKGSIDINKLKNFVKLYNGTEPECAKALDFDYNIKIVQYQKNFNLYPGEIVIRTVGLLPFICTTWFPRNDRFLLVKCNFDPTTCPGVCDACGEFDRCRIPRCPSNCGKDPVVGCPYSGSCTNVRTCPMGNPPNGVCCRYLDCPVDACDQIVSSHAPGHSSCWTVLGECNLSKCTVTSNCAWHGHCTKGFFEYTLPSGGYKNVNLSQKIFGFGVGFGASNFSPEKARYEEVRMSLPVVITYNHTFSTEGVVYIYAVKGELEILAGSIENFCDNVDKDPTQPLKLSKELHISLPVNYSSGKLCMTDSCKIIRCSKDVSFENITKEGDYILTFYYDPTKNKIEVKK